MAEGAAKLVGGLVLAGDAPGVGEDQLLLRDRAPTPARFLRLSWARNNRKRARVSAVSTGSTVDGSVGRGKQQHDESVLDAYLGHGGALRRTRAAAAWL